MVQRPRQVAVGSSCGIEFLGPLFEPVVECVGELLFQEGDAPVATYWLGAWAGHRRAAL
ncbi:hypothetical protein ABZ819_08930 [Streptomyces venezuelae]|uniref:hypothetical protein n=1 Tax=Streptomyces venezuelae TaxID=54571 RepID=UPI00341E12AE